MKRKKSLFIERSIMGALAFLKESLFADEYASKRGFFQARNHYIKVLTILALLATVLFLKSIPFIACIYALCLLLALSSSINLVFFLKRTWLFIPLFALCIAVPALFSAFSPGEALVSFKIFTLRGAEAPPFKVESKAPSQSNPEESPALQGGDNEGSSFTLSITKQGLANAGIFFLRVLTSVSLCALLVLTTKHTCLLKALRTLGVSQIFVMTLGMCYRYVYLFIEILQHTYLAIKSRTGGVSSLRTGRRIVAWNIASLWQRSFDLQNQVYQAMLSRGYSGEPKIFAENSVTLKDMLCLGTAIALFLAAIWQTHFLN